MPEPKILTVEEEKRIRHEQYRREKRIRLDQRRKDISVVHNKIISAGFNTTVGCNSDGSVVAVGDIEQDDPSSWKNLKAICAGDQVVVGLRNNGTVIEKHHQVILNSDVSKWNNIIAIDANTVHIVGLRSNKTVIATGSNYAGECDVNEWSDIIAVGAGFDHTVGLHSDGTVVAVGSNDRGQCKVQDWTDIVAISVGQWHTVGLHSDGTVIAVGFNNDGQCNVSKWRDIIAISANGWNTVGVKSNGTVVAVGSNIYGNCNVTDWQDIVAISAGFSNTVGVHSDGTVVSTTFTGEKKYDYGQCNTSNWKLFNSLKTFEQEQTEAKIRYMQEEKKREEGKRQHQEEVKQLNLNKTTKSVTHPVKKNNWGDMIIPLILLLGMLLSHGESNTTQHDEWHNFDNSPIKCRFSGCDNRPLYSDWENRYCSDHIILSENHSQQNSEVPKTKRINTERAMTKEEADALRGTGYHGTRPNSPAENLELIVAMEKCKECGMHTDNGGASLCDECRYNMINGLD